MIALPDALAGLRNGIVTRFVIDDALTIAVHAPGREMSLRIDAVGQLEHGDVAHRFSPDADPASVAPVLALLHQRVVEVVLDSDGRLELRFDGGASLSVFPDDHNLSWMVQSASGASAACLAEGRVVWQ